MAPGTKAAVAVVSLFVGAGAARAAYDVNEVTLGATEAQVKQHFPHANCRALEWKSRAADRRCDDSRIKLGGLDASVTFYLRRDAVEGMDVRFDRRHLEPMAKFLRQRYGQAAERKDALATRVEWKSGAEHARLVAEQGSRRASMLIWRGGFDEELYRIR